MRLAAVLVMAVAATPPPAAAQTAAAATAVSGGWTVPRTPDGQPDLQGVWDYGLQNILKNARATESGAPGK